MLSHMQWTSNSNLNVDDDTQTVTLGDRSHSVLRIPQRIVFLPQNTLCMEAEVQYERQHKQISAY